MKIRKQQDDSYSKIALKERIQKAVHKTKKDLCLLLLIKMLVDAGVIACKDPSPKEIQEAQKRMNVEENIDEIMEYVDMNIDQDIYQFTVDEVDEILNKQDNKIIEDMQVFNKENIDLKSTATSDEPKYTMQHLIDSAVQSYFKKEYSIANSL